MSEFIGWIDSEHNIILDHNQEIVRCEDCKHADTFVGDEDAWCDKHCKWLTRKDFCSRGERRDAE